MFRDILAAGATLAFGTDCPVEALDPLPGLYAAVTRQHADGTPRGGWHPAQRLTLDEALYAYTMGAAYASYQEQCKGSITPGKWADLTILSSDIHAAEPEILLSTRRRDDHLWRSGGLLGLSAEQQHAPVHAAWEGTVRTGASFGGRRP